MAGEERTVGARMTFAVDQTSAREIDKALKQIETKLAKTGSALAPEIEKAMKQVEAVINKSGDKISQDLLKSAKAAFSQGNLEGAVQGMRKVEERVAGVTRATREAAERARQMQEQFNKLRETSERLSNMGIKIAAVGAAISGPLVMAARSYVQYAGQAEAVSQRWIASTHRIEQAQMRVGRVVAEQVVPWMETGARVAEDMARIAEKHPGAIGGLLGAGAGLVASGGATAAAGQIMRFVVDAKSLAMQMAAAKLMDAAANKQLAAGGLMSKGAGGAAAAAGAGGIGGVALGVGGAILGGLALGTGVNEIAARTEWGKQAGLQTTGKFASVAAYGIGNALGGDLMGKEWFTAVAGFTGELDKTAAAAAKASLETQRFQDNISKGVIPEAAVNATMQYRKAEEQALKQYEAERNQAETQYAQERVRIEEQYEAERTQLVEDYNRERARAEADFQRSLQQQREDFQRSEAAARKAYEQQRADMTDQFQRDMEQLEADHRDRLEDLAADHKTRMDDLVANRDALGIVAEQRSYARQQQQEEEQFQKDRQRMADEYKRQMADLQKSFEEQRKARQEDFQRRMDEQQEEFDLQQARAKEDFQRRLDLMDTQHQQEMTLLEQQHRDYLNELKRKYEDEKRQRAQALKEQLEAMLGLERDTRNRYYQMMTDDLTNWLTDMKLQVDEILNDDGGGNTGGSTKKRASGGYAPYGRYLLGEQGTEFVLADRTTQKAEQYLGGQLTQDRLLTALGRSSKYMNMNQQLTLNGMGGADYRDIERMVARGTEQALEAFLEKI